MWSRLRPLWRARDLAAVHRRYHSSGVLEQTRWLGVTVWKCPLDLWVYQELASEVRPDLIVESGTAFGGSALYLASICDLLGHGRVLTIDIASQPGHPAHPRITYLQGSSIAPETLAAVRRAIRPGERVLAILDSDHRKAHVLAELRAYGPLVTPGSYLIVEDTNLNGHPVLPHFGPGPREAVQAFLAETDAFVPDRTREKFMLTFNAGGYLRRVR